jgi:hypothetical protein
MTRVAIRTIRMKLRSHDVIAAPTAWLRPDASLARRVFTWSAFISGLGVVACSSSPSTECIPGESVACVGVGGCTGGQICSSSGDSFGPCECAHHDSGSNDASLDSSHREGGMDSAHHDGPVDGTISDSSHDRIQPDAPADSAHDIAVDSPTDSTPDAPVDTGVDASADGVSEDVGSADSAADGATDSAVDSPTDTGTDVPVDVGSDAQTDAGDAGSPICVDLSQCPTGMKNCGGACVLANDPYYGCDPTTCDSCVYTLPNAIAGCSGTECVIASCVPGYANCDGIMSNGCEADLTDTATCTSCANSCGAGEQCVSSGCVSACVSPDTNCAGTCADLTSDVHACGSCSVSCVGPNGAECSGSKCTCAPGLTACSGKCADTSWDPEQCGGCSGCLADPMQLGGSGLGPECDNGTCRVGCDAPYSLCGSSTCTVTSSDPSNCGTCGTVCGAGDVCLAGACQPLTVIELVPGLISPNAVAIDGANIYWTDIGDDTVNQAPITGGTRRILASSSPGAMTIDNDAVYWFDASGHALSVPKGGGTVTTIGSGAGGVGIAVDANNIYWASSGASFYAMAKTTGTVTTLYTTSACGSANALALSGGNLYATTSSCVVEVYPTGGGTIVANPPSSSYSYATANGFGLVWERTIVRPTVTTIEIDTEGGTGSITIPQNGSGSAPYFTPGPLAPDGCGEFSGGGVFALDGSHQVIWAIDGTLPVRVFAGASSANQIVTDNSYIYWTDGGGWIGRISR